MRIFRYIPEVLLLPFILKKIGEDAYGIYVLAWSVLISLDRIESSITSAVIKFNASHIVNNKIKEINKLISTTFLASLCLALAAIMGIVIIINYYPEFIKLERNQMVSSYIDSFYIISATIVLSFPMMPYVGVVYSLQRHDYFYIIETIVTIIKAILIVCWFSLIEASATVLITICGFAFFLPRFMMVIKANKSIPNIKIRLRNCNWDIFKNVLSFGGFLLLSSICYIINYAGVKWMMGLIVSIAFVAHLEIMLMPSRVISQFILSTTLTIMPVASKYSTLGDIEKLARLFVRGTRYIVLLLLSIIILASLLISPVISSWIGEKYVFLSKYIFVLIIFKALSNTAQCANQILRGVGDVKLILLCSLLSQAVLPVMSTLIAFLFCRNPYLSVTTGLSMGFALYFIMLTYFCLRLLKVSYKYFLLKVFLQPAIIAIPIIFLFKALIIYCNIVNFAILILISILGVAIFAVLFHMLFMTNAEKGMIKQIVNLLFLNKSKILTKA